MSSSEKRWKPEKVKPLPNASKLKEMPVKISLCLSEFPSFSFVRFVVPEKTTFGVDHKGRLFLAPKSVP